MDLTLDQAKDVISNAQNPNHAAFHQNTNPDVVAAVNKAFEVAYPGETMVGGSPELESQMAAALAEQPPPAQAQSRDNLPPEVAQAEAAATTELRGKWGADYDQNLAVVAEQVNKIFKGDWEKYADFIVENSIDIDPKKQVEYSEFLLKMARK